MTKTFFLAILASMGAALAIPGYCQTPNFGATLSGANAIPPNSSPFRATGRLSFGDLIVGGNPSPFGVPSDGVLVSNTLLAQVWFTPSNLVNDLGIEPATATIQSEVGEVVAELPQVTNNPSTLFPDGPTVPKVRYAGFFVLSPQQATDLFGGRWYIHVSAATLAGENYPAGAIRGQVLPVAGDDDGDGLPNDRDQCPGTQPGAAVDGDGCSIEQLCPCNGPWKNHQEYVKCVKREVLAFFKEGRISQADGHAIVKQAERSDCGNPMARAVGR